MRRSEDSKSEGTVSIAGKVKFRRGEGDKARTTSGRDSVVQTGGGVYIGGSVSTGGGDFVGRDQFKGFYPEDASVDKLKGLLTEIGGLLSDENLDPEIASEARNDLAVVEKQMERDRPIAGLIRAKLGGMSELIRETGEGAESAVKILGLLERALVLVKSLF